jgi:hypothetical protein
LSRRFLSFLLRQFKPKIFAQLVGSLDAATAAIHYPVQNRLVNAGILPNLVAAFAGFYNFVGYNTTLQFSSVPFDYGDFVRRQAVNALGQPPWAAITSSISLALHNVDFFWR